MKLIGIDPGSHRIGYSVLEKNISKNKISILTYGTIEVPPKTESPENLLIISEKLEQIAKDYEPDYASVEELFFHKNQKTASMVYQARGVIVFTLAKQGIKIVEPTVTQIKKGVTGDGNADKKQVRHALQIILGVRDLKGLDDSWDAIAAAFVGFGFIRR